MTDVTRETVDRIKLIVFGGLCVLAILYGARNIVRDVRSRQRRNAGLKTVAQTLGFRFEGSYASLSSRFGNFGAFTSPYGNVGQNLMTGVIAGHAVTVMDDIIPATRGGHERTWTLALFPDAARGLPDFQLTSVSTPRILGSLVANRIEFPGNPEFSKHYTVQGKDENAIRRAFDDSTLRFLATHQSWDVETRSGAATVSRASRSLEPNQLPDFLAEAVQVLERFRRP
jgi:hypothetical protein